MYYKLKDIRMNIYIICENYAMNYWSHTINTIITKLKIILCTANWQMLIHIATTALQGQTIIQDKIFICALRGAGWLHYKCASTNSYFIWAIKVASCYNCIKVFSTLTGQFIELPSFI